MLEVQGLRKTYKRLMVLADIDKAFPVGVTVITGPSGAGKSTLLRLCASAETPSSGDILWNGQSIIKRPKPFRQILGYAPQRIDFPEDISALDFLCHIGALKGISSQTAAKQGRALLDRVGLAQDALRLIRTFSGGMRRRLGLIQAFFGESAMSDS